MNPVRSRSAILIALASPMAFAESAQEQANGFIEDSTWSVLNRTVYDSREYRHGASNSAPTTAQANGARSDGRACRANATVPSSSNSTNAVLLATYRVVST